MLLRPIRLLLVFLLLGAISVVAYTYLVRHGGTLRLPTASITEVDTEKARESGAELARKAADTTKAAAERGEEILGEAAVTAKIKSKMALDDYVKARTIDVDTQGTVVTLTGTVNSDEERQRALRLAKETEGITQVVDNLQVVK